LEEAATAVAATKMEGSDADTEVEEPLEAPPKAAPTPVRKKPPQPMASPEVPIFANFSAVEKAFDDGYDTKADAGPEEYNADEDAPLFEAKAVESNAVIEEDEERATVPIFVALSPAKIVKLTIAKLKHELQIRAVPYSSTDSEETRAAEKA
jgi:hypothetical protein